MKKNTFLLFYLLCTPFLFADIVHRDITDFEFHHNSWVFLDIDFNNDGIAEFTLDEQGGGVVGTFFDPDSVNFIGTGTFDSGHGWDIMRVLQLGHTIDANGLYEAMGDAYINAFWANPDEIFPEGESFIGVKFKLGANTHYGWLRVHSTSGVISLLDYAYNDTPGAPINAGDTTLSIGEFENTLNAKIYPNPARDYIIVQSSSIIDEAILINLEGKTIELTINNNYIDISKITPGFYMLYIKVNEKSTMKKIMIH